MASRQSREPQSSRGALSVPCRGAARTTRSPYVLGKGADAQVDAPPCLFAAASPNGDCGATVLRRSPFRDVELSQ